MTLEIRQLLIDEVARGVFSQGRVPEGRYRARQSWWRRLMGRRPAPCGVGHVLTDEEWTPEMEHHSPMELLERGMLPDRLGHQVLLLDDIQRQHDETLSRIDLLSRLGVVAEKWMLDPREIDRMRHQLIREAG